jgi:hypothetical protein
LGQCLAAAKAPSPLRSAGALHKMPASRLVVLARYALSAGPHVVRITTAGSRRTGVSGAPEHGIRQIFVTLATPPQSIPYAGSLPDATPLEGWTEPTHRLRIGRETEGKSFQLACNRLATCLQLLCNSGTAPALAGCHPGTDREPRPHSSRGKAALLRRRGSTFRGGDSKRRRLCRLNWPRRARSSMIFP